MQRSRDSIAAVLCFSVSLLLSACASPVEGWWPPSPDSAAQTIYVSLDTWHAVIALPVQPAGYDQPSPFSFEKGTSPQHSSRSTQHFYEEWGYAERAWYLEDRRGLTGMLRALFWPTEGVVEVGQYEQVWADRTPQPPSDLFVFRVSDEGFRRLRRHLRATVSGDEPIASLSRSTFYPAVRSYHVLHTCHQYAASALREAGLPISALWAFNRTSLAWQLRRTARVDSGYAVEASPDEPMK
ncbi:MAG: DUF2459 domain-containing protein [Nitrospira sp.]|nr:DUF2459 domain-containing protein [Nitrospira sp.]